VDEEVHASNAFGIGASVSEQAVALGVLQLPGPRPSILSVPRPRGRSARRAVERWISSTLQPTPRTVPCQECETRRRWCSDGSEGGEWRHASAAGRLAPTVGCSCQPRSLRARGCGTPFLGCFTDYGSPDLVEHPERDLIAQESQWPCRGLRDVRAPYSWLSCASFSRRPAGALQPACLRARSAAGSAADASRVECPSPAAAY
jgi:hypothetical protein